jgi:hypothetical protein
VGELAIFVATCFSAGQVNWPQIVRAALGTCKRFHKTGLIAELLATM